MTKPKATPEEKEMHGNHIARKTFECFQKSFEMETDIMASHYLFTVNELINFSMNIFIAMNVNFFRSHFQAIRNFEGEVNTELLIDEFLRRLKVEIYEAKKEIFNDD